MNSFDKASRNGGFFFSGGMRLLLFIGTFYIHGIQLLEYKHMFNRYGIECLSRVKDENIVIDLF